MSKPFELPEEMTIYSALETRDALLAWAIEQTAQAEQMLEVSAARVREIDGAGLQLLAALANTGQPWRLIEPSPAMVDACQTLGLSDWLPAASPSA
jgi:ABC-type transporter Mla MlaB component